MKGTESVSKEIVIIDSNLGYAGLLQKSIIAVSGARGKRRPISRKNVRRYDPAKFIDSNSLATKIARTYSDGTDQVYFVNADLKFGKSTFEPSAGIELLLWLRTKGILGHCVLYSPDPAQKLIGQSLRNAIIASLGTTFLQIPNDFASVDVFTLKGKTAAAENLKAYLRAAFDQTEFQHRDANWWGMKQLWDTHRVFTEGKFQEPYPQLIAASLTQLNSAVGAYLHSLETTDVLDFARDAEKRVKELKRETKTLLQRVDRKAKVVGEDAESRFQNAKECQRKVEFLKRSLKRSRERGRSRGFQRFGASIDRQLGSLNNAIAQLESVRPNKKDEDRIGEDLSQRITSVGQALSDIYPAVKRELFEIVPSTRIGKGIKLLLIDDLAEQGFRTIMERMTQRKVYSIVPPTEYRENIRGLFEKVVKPKIISLDPGVVLLDLRLFDEPSRGISSKRLSGKLLLDQITSTFREMPIVVMTASRDIWTHNVIMKAGAEGYWVKEGIDERATAQDSAKNYTRLLVLLSQATDVNHQKLRRFSNLVADLSLDSRPQWFADVNWINGERTKANVQAIASTLRDSVELVRGYLRSNLIDPDGKRSTDESFFISGIINKLAGIVENVHQLETVSGGHRAFIARRDDKAGLKLLSIRNRYSHTNFRRASWTELWKCGDRVENYLSTRPN